MLLPVTFPVRSQLTSAVAHTQVQTQACFSTPSDKCSYFRCMKYGCTVQSVLSLGCRVSIRYNRSRGSTLYALHTQCVSRMHAFHHNQTIKRVVQPVTCPGCSELKSAVVWLWRKRTRSSPVTARRQDKRAGGGNGRKKEGERGVKDGTKCTR